MRAHIVCPNCGNDDDFSCDHVLSGQSPSFGPWFCDNCGHSIRGTLAPDGSIEIEAHTERSIKTVDVLVLKPQQKPVYFVLKGSRHEGGHWQFDNRDDAESKRYYYDEHSCPMNWLEPAMVYHDGDADPHGLIEFVATRDDSTFPPDENYGPNARDAAFIEFIEQLAAPSRPSPAENK